MVLFLLLLVGGAAAAQRPPSDTFTLDEGLLNATLTDLAQDASGRLWILSMRGVSVYDGRSFTHFGPDDGLPTKEFGALTVDAEGRPWLVTRWYGPTVSYFDGQRWRSLPVPATTMPLSKDSTRRVVHLAVRSPRGGAGDKPPPRDDPRSSIVAVATYDAGLWLWDGTAWQYGVEGLPEQGFTDVVAFERGLAVATSAGLCRLEDGRGDCRFTDPRLAQPLFAVAASREGARERLWVLSRRWLGYLEDERLHVTAELEEGIVAPSVYDASITPDAAGGVYFGQPHTVLFLPPGGEPQPL